MSLAPAPQLAACLEVLYLAAIRARMLGCEGHTEGLSREKSDQIAALMDAVHNIPHLVSDWEHCDEALLRGMLKDYDTRWGGAGLLATYDRVVREHIAP